MSQASTIAASSQPESLSQAPPPALADPPDARSPVEPQSPGALEDITTPFQASSHAQSSGPTYCGGPPQPTPAPISGASPPVHFAHADPFARARIAAAQSRVAAPVLSDPRPPPSAPVFSPFRDGHYWCSKCPRRGFTTIPGLMRHVTHQHAGSSVDEATCSLFAAIERVTCTAPGCGGLRRMGARICNRCGQASLARPPKVGDVIMGPLGAPASREDVVMADVEAHATPSLTVEFPPIVLPAGFTQRIRALPSSTILHVPASCRLRMISVVAQCWHGMAQGRDDYAQLEEGRSKLLLSTVPQGLSVASEVQKRLTLWEERSFEVLLQRAEEQFLLNRKAGKRRKTNGPSDPSERGDRARRTAAVGAYRKATTGLVSSMLSFPEEEDKRWAQELLPISELGSAAHSDPHLAPPPALPESTWDRPFSGLHYAALTAPGPTGTRPEHITDLLNVPRRIHANKIHAALSELFRRISAGSLPPAARWLTRTRLCWQRKKNGKPRPIKMGEFLRSAYAKRLVNLSQVHLRTKTLRMHQWGVNLPGACEALCHWRGTIEPLVLNGTIEPLVAADLDLVNMFGNAEWPRIRAALRTHFPEASSWTEWQHQSDSVTTLPSGCEFSTDRGAEQGDVLGTIQSALVLGDARASHLQDFLSSPFEQKGVCDEWFVDDGQCFVRPMLFDRWLRALDSALASFGATRGRIALGNAKSSARLLCPPERFHEFSGWDTPYVRDTVAVLSPDAGATALGSAFGTREQINARAWESVRACDELRSAINGVDHAPTELVLTRQCADVSKLLYHMRINGDILDYDLLASFDGQLRASVASSLAGDLPDHSWWQATTGVAVGGLGLRTAVTVALPAFVASRILSRPLVSTMVDHLCAAIGASRQTIMSAYDARTDEALSRLASTLPTAAAFDLLAKLDEAYAECHLSWQNVLSGSEPAMQDQPPPAPRHARGITPDDGDGDEEHPHSRKRTKIQGVITACLDSGIRESLLQMHENEGSWVARSRLAELSDSSVDHTWLWRLNPRHGLTLEADEYIDSVRFRLGCAGPVEPVTCAACNSGILDTGAAHASCCALGEATRGHNAVSSLLHAAAQQCDHTAEMEVPGLIPGTDLRPADILTSALGNAYTALDVSICSPHAGEAGADCTVSRVQAKLQHYGPHLDSLLRQNISYCPVVWSAYGRPHPDTLAVLRSLSKSIARKRNVASAEVVFRRLHSSITLEIWRRTARQVRACWPTTAPLVELELGI